MNASRKVESRKPISESLAHKRIESADAQLVVPSLHVINKAVARFCQEMNDFDAEYNPGPLERIAFVRGLAMITGFQLASAQEYLDAPYSNSSFGEEPFPETSQAKLAEIAITLIQIVLGFHQAARYITAVAGTTSDNDITPELIVAKDDTIIKGFYDALRATIPEFSMPQASSKTVN